MDVIVYVRVLCDYDIIAIIVIITGSTGNRPPPYITGDNTIELLKRGRKSRKPTDTGMKYPSEE